MKLGVILQKDFTPTEAIAIGKRIEERLPSAKSRMADAGKAGGQKAGRGRPDRGGQSLPILKRNEFNRTESRTAKAVGMSRET